MTVPAPLAVSIGECMVELSRGSDGRFGLAFGGDTFNTAVYLARAGVATTYATALGDDPYSAGILALAAAEGVGIDLVQVHPGRMPGLYLIETTAQGERTFHYWRDRSPARDLFDAPDARTIVAAIESASLVYLSGITLSLYSAAGLDRLAASLDRARNNGATIAMDGNYRPRGWVGDTDRARSVFERFWRLADIALPTFDDEAMLWGDTTSSQTIVRLETFGVREIALKLGPEGALVADGDRAAVAVPVPMTITAIDTTAAGDSFNAAYLAARRAGHSGADAALAGHRLAGVVIGHRGAIAPREATAEVLGGLVRPD